MKLFIEEEELKEIDPLENLNKSDDSLVVIQPTIGRRGESRTDEVKEIIALDTLNIGPALASQIHGISDKLAENYSNGKSISDPDKRANILSRKHEIADVAVTKLMDTLNLINPERDSKTNGKLAQTADALSRVVDRIQGKKDDGKPETVIHVYLPNQKKESDYVVIDV